MDPDNREYILNGNFVVSMFKKVMQYGGVLLSYTGSDSVTERVNCSKQLQKDLELYVSSTPTSLMNFLCGFASLTVSLHRNNARSSRQKLASTSS